MDTWSIFSQTSRGMRYAFLVLNFTWILPRHPRSAAPLSPSVGRPTVGADVDLEKCIKFCLKVTLTWKKSCFPIKTLGLLIMKFPKLKEPLRLSKCLMLTSLGYAQNSMNSFERFIGIFKGKYKNYIPNDCKSRPVYRFKSIIINRHHFLFQLEAERKYFHLNLGMVRILWFHLSFLLAFLKVNIRIKYLMIAKSRPVQKFKSNIINRHHFLFHLEGERKCFHLKLEKIRGKRWVRERIRIICRLNLFIYVEAGKKYMYHNA